MRNKKLLLLVFIIAFLFRLLLVNTAHHGDLNNNISWGNTAIKYGLNGLYNWKTSEFWEFSPPNQPPLYILLFSLTSFIYQGVSNVTMYLNNHLGVFPSSFVWFWQQRGMDMVVKLPSILADLGIGFVIYKISKKWWLALLWLINPLSWYNSSIWGQTDSIVNFIGLLSIFFLLKKNLVYSMVYIVLSILFKPSLIIFLPIIFIVWIQQRYDLKIWFRSILYAAFFIFIVSVWFHPNFDLPIWLFNLYTNRIFPGEIGDLSANAFNLWYLVNPGKVLDSIIYFGLSARVWGFILTSIVIIIAIVRLRQNKNKRTLFYSLAVIALTSFLFMTRIHERYLYPFFPIATILVGLIPEFIIPYVILSITFLLNMYNLFWAPGIPVLENILKTTQLPLVLSVINILVFFFILSFFVRMKFKK